MKIKTAAIIANSNKIDSPDNIRSLVKWLEKRDVKCVTEDTAPQDSFFHADFLIVLGGDGTVLKCAAEAAKNGIPVLGINTGNLGYLTDVDVSEMYISLEKVISGDYTVEKRMTLQAVLKDGYKAICLNEFCIEKRDTHMIMFDVSLNGEYVNTYRADGVLVATPTGSTAYNLSAKGPILKPCGNMIAITPICPHDLFALPSVVSGDDTITITILPGAFAPAALSGDGKPIATMNAGDNVTIQASAHCFSLIKTNALGFFEVLRKKMSYS